MFLDIRPFSCIKFWSEDNSAVCYLTEFGEVILLAEGTLPQPCGIVSDGLVVTLSLRPPVSNTSYYTGDQLTWKKRRQSHKPHQLVIILLSLLLWTTCAVTTVPNSQTECWWLGRSYACWYLGTITLRETCIFAESITNIKGLWSFLGEQIKDLLSVGDSVGNSEIFVPAAQLCTNIIQSNSFVAVTLQEHNNRRKWKCHFGNRMRH